MTKLTKVYLTDEDLQLLDPTGRGRTHMRRFVDGPPVPVPPTFRKFTSEQWFALYSEHRKRCFTQRHSPYWEFVDTQLKHYGKAGATFDRSVLIESLTTSYELAGRSVGNPRLTIGRDFLLRLIKQRAERYGYPQIGYEIGVCGTSAGLPTMAKKGDFLAETVIGSDFRHLVPDLPGQRNYRNKPRIIHQDANSNVRYAEPYLRAVRKWLAKYVPEYFGSWLNPNCIIRPYITGALQRKWTSIESDYTKCDEHTSWELVSTYVLPVYEVLLNDMEYAHIASYMEEAFYQEVFMGEYKLVGLHNLFSGQPITNDVETIFDVVLILSAALPVLERSDFKLLCCGDDITILTSGRGHNGKKTRRNIEQVHNDVIELANAAGHEMNPQKCAICTDRVHYLRNVYYCGAPTAFVGGDEPVILGAYPTILVLNNHINPERYSEAFWTATFQRFDSAAGSTDFAPFLAMVLSNARLPDTLDLTTEPMNYDWWYRVYGEAWDPRTSPSVRLAQRMGFLCAKS